MKFADYIYKSLTEDRGLKIHLVMGCSLCAEGLVASLGLRGRFWSFNRLNKPPITPFTSIGSTENVIFYFIQLLIVW